jgi:hypothetical protein
MGWGVDEVNRMQIERQADGVKLALDGRELRLLRWALERATFTDTPVAEQEAIASFCARLLEALPGA